MASTNRASFAERSGGALPEKTAVNGSARTRTHTQENSGSKNERSEAKRRTVRSPTQPSDKGDKAGFAAGSHKRSVSGKSFPESRTLLDERERRTEKITTKETFVTRTKSPDRRSRAPSEKSRADGAARPSFRKREMRAEPVAQSPSQVTPWDPEARLMPHTSAPLASRISIAPLSLTMPASLQPKPLQELSLEQQEAVMVEDLLFVLMGYEGQYIRFAKAYKPTEERDRLAGPTYRILPGLDPSLQDLAQPMLRMATHHSALEAFVEAQSRDEFGSVNHALCASVRKFLHDYLILVAQLETQFLSDDAFTLHVLHMHVLPTSHVLLQLHALTQDLLKRNALLDEDEDEDEDGDAPSDSAGDFEHILEQLREGGDLVPGNMTGKKMCKGGVVLGLMAKRLEASSGDPTARALLTCLLRDASRPYMAMLNEWLHHGGISDPHSEFMVKEQKSFGRERLEHDYTDEYWEKRYTMRTHDVPPQLEAVKDKVLLAGKYLNVVRECGGVDVSKKVDDVPTSFDDARFLDNVNQAYAHANSSLMQLLVTTHALPARLRSLKHYFFLDPSDYFSYFLELGASELRKTVKSVNTAKLQSLLDIVLRQPGSAVSLDPFKEDVKVEMNDITLVKSLQRVVNITGMEQGEALALPTTGAAANSSGSSTGGIDKNATGFTSLQFDYAVPFPVSLVISRKTVWRYQALFRYLLSLRHLESQLSSTTWQTHTRGLAWLRRSSSPRVEGWKRRVWTLRARMLVFVQQLLYFCTAEVIEPNWQSLMGRLRAKDKAGAVSRTVDELMQDHVDFLNTCLKECMLTNSKLLRIHSKLMQTCNIFAQYTNWLTRELEKTDPDLNGPTKPGDMTNQQWGQFQAVKAQRAAASSSNPGDVSTLSAKNGAGGSVNAEARVAELSEILKKWETNFSRHLQILLDALNHYAATETVVLLSLCARLSTANQGTDYAGLRHDPDDGGGA